MHSLYVFWHKYHTDAFILHRFALSFLLFLTFGGSQIFLKYAGVFDISWVEKHNLMGNFQAKIINSNHSERLLFINLAIHFHLEFQSIFKHTSHWSGHNQSAMFFIFIFQLVAQIFKKHYFSLTCDSLASDTKHFALKFNRRQCIRKV